MGRTCPAHDLKVDKRRLHALRFNYSYFFRHREAFKKFFSGAFFKSLGKLAVDNDLVNPVSRSYRVIFYKDDISKWAANNGLEVNASMMIFVSFTRMYKIRRPTFPMCTPSASF